MSDHHAAEQLRPEQLTWLATLSTTSWVSGDVLRVHGTPGSDLTCFLETVTEEWLRTATRAEVEQRAGNVDAAVILCGHTHLQRAMTLDDGRLIVNPGSVGLPAYDNDRPYPHLVESGSPHARYAIFRKGESGWAADLHL